MIKIINEVKFPENKLKKEAMTASHEITKTKILAQFLPFHNPLPIKKFNTPAPMAKAATKYPSDIINIPKIPPPKNIEPKIK